MVRNRDWPGAKEIADRLKKMLPPQLLAQEEGGQTPEQQLAQAQAQLNQMQQLMVGQQGELQKLRLEKAGKVIDNEYELKATQLQNDMKVLIALIQAKTQETQQEQEMYRQFWLENHGAAHEIAMQHHQQLHEKELADQQAQMTQQQAAMAPTNGQ